MQPVPFYARLRRVVIALALLPVLWGSALPAHAAKPRDTSTDRPRFMGQVTSVVGPNANPTGFAIQLGTQMTDIRIAPKTTFVARSAEAEVEGLLTGDYASVVAKRVNRLLVAVRVVFDVAPVAPMHIFTGLILRMGPDVRRFVVKMDTGRTVPLRLVKTSRLHMEGAFAGGSPVLLKGEYVEVLAVREAGGWSAYDVTIRPGTQQSARR